MVAAKEMIQPSVYGQAIIITVYFPILALTGIVSEKEIFFIRWAKSAYEPVLRASIEARLIVVPAAVVAFALSAWLFTRLGQEFIPTLDEKDIAMHAMRIPSTSLTQSQTMQTQVEQAVSKIPEVAFIYSKTGTAELASDPMPPNVSDTFIILKPKEEWRSEDEMDRLIAELTEAAEKMNHTAMRMAIHTGAANTPKVKRAGTGTPSSKATKASSSS